MMKLAVTVALLVTVSVVSGELLNMLHMLHQSDAFHYLTPQEQVFLVELIAAAEACKLTPLVHSYGHDAVVALINHLPGNYERPAQEYIQDHLQSEQHGTCVPNANWTPHPHPTSA